MEPMGTLTEVLSDLKDLGWDNEFKVIEKNKIEINGIIYKAKEIELIKTYRFEGNSNPSDQAIIYVIKTHLL